MPSPTARRLFQLVEPIAVVTYLADEPTDAVMALGAGNVWDAYFAGRAAALGRNVSPEVVHALFYNFADGEVARHIPQVWDRVSPEAANAARQRGSVAALRRILGDLAEGPGVGRAADLLVKAGTVHRLCLLACALRCELHDAAVEAEPGGRDEGRSTSESGAATCSS